jgi:hypothetical protein
MMVALGISIASASVNACSSSSSESAPARSTDAGTSDTGTVVVDDASTPTVDADVGPPPTKIAVTTRIPPTSLAPGLKANATWAVWREANATEWTTLAPAEAGSYGFESVSGRWMIAFACADAQSALVTVFERSAATTTLDVPLAEHCRPEGTLPHYFSISGTLSHIPTSTGWLDFAWELGSRGAVLPTTGTSATYEEVNVLSGTWDFMFGLREDAPSSLSKIAIVRGHALTADETLDFDLAMDITPGKKALKIHDIAAGEAVTAPIRYTTNGAESGLDLGPQTLPDGADIQTTYAEIPATSRLPTDLHRLDLSAADGDAALRGIRGSFKQPIDLDVTLPTPLEAARITVVGTTPYLRLGAKLKPRTNAAWYDAEVFVKITNKSLRVWRYSTDAVPSDGGEIDVTLPDISKADGFDTAWVLPTDRDRTVTLTVNEKPETLGDGTTSRYASRIAVLSPD